MHLYISCGSLFLLQQISTPGTLMNASILSEQSIAKVLDEASIQIKKIEDQIQNPIYDRCYGALFGSMIGNSLGGYCQVVKNKIKEEEMKHIMSMPGGGVHKLAAGQVTGDSELAFSLLSSLQFYEPKTSLKEQITPIILLIAYSYIAWTRTSPISCSESNQNGINVFLYNLEEEDENQILVANGNEAFRQVSANSKNYENNSSLMRIVPLGIFHALICQFKSSEKNHLNDLIKNEISITNGNKSCTTIGAEWTQMLSKLIRRKDPINDVQKVYLQTVEGKAKPEWKKDIKDGKNTNATQKQEQLSHCYINSLINFKNLVEKKEPLNAQTYKKYIKQIIQLGGDTDTNACIMGGLLGAIVGFKGLPQEYLQKMLKMQMKGERKRPDFFHPRMGLKLVCELLDKFKGK